MLKWMLESVKVQGAKGKVASIDAKIDKLVSNMKSTTHANGWEHDSTRPNRPCFSYFILPRVLGFDCDKSGVLYVEQVNWQQHCLVALCGQRAMVTTENVT